MLAWNQSSGWCRSAWPSHAICHACGSGSPRSRGTSLPMWRGSGQCISTARPTATSAATPSSRLDARSSPEPFRAPGDPPSPGLGPPCRGTSVQIATRSRIGWQKDGSAARRRATRSDERGNVTYLIDESMLVPGGLAEVETLDQLVVERKARIAAEQTASELATLIAAENARVTAATREIADLKALLATQTQRCEMLQRELTQAGFYARDEVAQPQTRMQALKKFFAGPATA